MKNGIFGVAIAIALGMGVVAASSAVRADDWGSFGRGFDGNAFASGFAGVSMPDGMRNGTVGNSSMSSTSHYSATAFQQRDGSWKANAFGEQSAKGSGNGAGGGAGAGFFNFNAGGFSFPTMPGPCCKG